MSSLRIYLLGPPRFELNGSPLRISRRKSIALLSFLAVSGQPHSRDTLATMLWPEYDQSGARANLRKELSRLKRSLEGEDLIDTGELLALGQGKNVWLDVEVFRTLLGESGIQENFQEDTSASGDGEEQVAALESAVGLYTGDFMAGFSLPDSPEFDDWQFFQADSLRRSLAGALDSLIHQKIASVDYPAAIEYARRWLALDVLHEPAHRQLMKLYTWSDQRAAALRQYEECVRLLETELGVEPEEATLELYQLIKARQLPPPEDKMGLEALAALPSNLPASASPFVGRENEQRAIRKLLVEDPNCRLLTLVGPGGVGKTRLAIQAAAGIRDEFTDGTFLVTLAPISSADHILSAIAEEIHFRFQEAADHQTQLFDCLRPKRMLLVLDNFEHLVSGATLVSELLEAAPEVKVLATSRVRLDLRDEVIYPLAGLAFPDDRDDHSSDEGLMSFDAIRLLVQTARRVRPGYELRLGDFNHAARICRMVEGMPLGIVLATGWLELLTLSEIADEIARSLDFLESEARDLPKRQRSLRGIFDTSWSLLDEDERDVLMKLTVFRGNFTRQAAQAISGASLPSLLKLVHKSWLQRNDDERFVIHELLRQYALERLQEVPDAWNAANDKHSTYFASLLHEQKDLIHGPRQADAFNVIASEFENIRGAWDWSIRTGKFDRLIDDMLPAVYTYCESRAKSVELMELVKPAIDVLERPDPGGENDLARTILYVVEGSFYRKGDPVRYERIDVPIPAYEETIWNAWTMASTLDDLIAMGFWGALLAYIYGHILDRHSGRDRLSLLVDHFRRMGLTWELGASLEMLGLLHLDISLYTNDKTDPLDEAGRCLEEALTIFQRLGDERECGYTLMWLGNYFYRRQRWTDGIASWQSAKDKLTAVGDTVSSIHWLIGDLYLRVGQVEEALRFYHDAGREYAESGHKRIAAYSYSRESFEALRYSDVEHARSARELSLQLSQEVGDDFGVAWSTWEMSEIQRVAGDLTSAREGYERARMMLEEAGEANGLNFYHRGMGDIALATGDSEEAFRHFQESQQQASQTGHLWGEAYAWGGMGKSEARLGRPAPAQRDLLRGLQIASGLDDLGLSQMILIGFAELYAVLGDTARAAEICALVIHSISAWNETREQANSLLDGLDVSSSEEGGAAYERGKNATIWEMAERVLHFPAND